VLFGVMGTAIAVQTVMTILVAVALWRQAFDDRPLGWALRLGLAVSIAGASIGGLMTRPTDAQLADARAGRSLTRVGAHTVGAPDGGPGMPGTGWSRDHGDLRVAHFVGLHAMQILPIVALLVRRGSETARARLVIVAAASHATLFALLLWQALRGIPVAHPDAETADALAVWAVATLAAVMWRRDPVRPRVAEVAL
jgi:hypothetical protein